MHHLRQEIYVYSTAMAPLSRNLAILTLTGTKTRILCRGAMKTVNREAPQAWLRVWEPGASQWKDLEVSSLAGIKLVMYSSPLSATWSSCSVQRV